MDIFITMEKTEKISKVLLKKNPLKKRVKQNFIPDIWFFILFSNKTNFTKFELVKTITESKNTIFRIGGVFFVPFLLLLCFYYYPFKLVRTVFKAVEKSKQK